MASKPVIFLAFANDRIDDAAYLRNLPKELHGIRAALDKAVRADLCEVVERANTTIADIMNVFQDERYRDRIAIFHYGGHANGYQLLLETAEGHHAAAHSGGLVSFLASQLGLKMVFLNGCSSQQQSLDLIKEGISSVVGTSQSINDNVATSLAVRFYTALGSGMELSRAWKEAIDQVKMQTGAAQGNMRDLFWEGDEAETVADRFPWDIYYKEGAELVKHWNLPEAVENPLFGLPEPAVQYDLPGEPYRFLQRYTREQASIFFGRSYYIRDLYRSAVDRITAPVILFYGQSGVGKSSMLDAGLFPRLERSHQVVYARRNQTTGLLGTLREALGLGEGGEPLYEQQYQIEEQRLLDQIKQLEWLASQTEEGAKQNIEEAIHALEEQAKEKEINLQGLQNSLSKDNSIKDAWLTIEKEGGKPLIILLDQVEEVYTRANNNIKAELEQFLDEVQGLFSQVNNRPEGKLILSYRKEYHPEIKEACVMRAIPKEEIFLKALTRKDIIEVISGLTKTERLQRKYQLQIEDELPVIIADDLLEDKDSPIAPVLQILLTKLWKMTEEDQHRLFSVQHYQGLRSQGILMDDFFHEQMEQLQQKFPEQVASGLALDILHYHTTKLGTAGSRNLEELRMRYADRQKTIDEIVEHFKSLYLLTDAGEDETGLAHDTLAPLVVNEFRHSDKPGQRGAIILENKLIAYEQNPEVVIDIDDLKVVDQGASGMRLWISQEQDLIDKSREKKLKIENAKKRNKRLGILAVIIIIGVAIFAFGQSRIAIQRQAEAEEQRKEAEGQKREAENQKTLADLQALKADSARKEALQQSILAEKAKLKADLEALRAEKSAELAKSAQKEAEEKRISAQLSEQEALKQTGIAKEQTLIAAAAAEDAELQKQRAEYQLLLSNARQVAVKSVLMDNNDTIKALLAITAYNLQEKAHQDYDRKKLSSGNENSREIFEALERSLKQFANDSLYAGESWSFANSNKNIAISNERGRVLIGKLVNNTQQLLPSFRAIYDLSNLQNNKIYQLLYLEESLILMALGNGEVVLANGNQISSCYQHEHENILALGYNASSQQVYSAAEDNKFRAWSLANKKDIWEVPTSTLVHELAVDEKNQRVYGVDEGGNLLEWQLTKDHNPPASKVLGNHKHPLTALAYSPKLQLLVAGCSHGDVIGFDIKGERELKVFTGKHLGGVTSLAFNEAIGLLASSSYDGQIFSWKIQSHHLLADLALQVPATLRAKEKIFSLAFTSDNNYLLFSDRKAMRLRTINPELLYEKLQKITENRSITPEEWAIYIGDGVAMPY